MKKIIRKLLNKKSKALDKEYYNESDKYNKIAMYFRLKMFKDLFECNKKYRDKIFIIIFYVFLKFTLISIFFEVLWLNSKIKDRTTICFYIVTAITLSFSLCFKDLRLLNNTVDDFRLSYYIKLNGMFSKFLKNENKENYNNDIDKKKLYNKILDKYIVSFIQIGKILKRR